MTTSVEDWHKSLTLPYEDVPEGPEGPITGATLRVEHGVGSAVTVDVLGSGDHRVNVTPYVTGACKIIENETGKVPMQLVSQFADDHGHGIEILVIPNRDQPAGASIIG